MSLFGWLAPRVTAHAHCDIPCGIYDPSTAKIAADTIAKMVEKIEGFAKEIALKGDDLTARNNFIRSVQVKEEHAQICKRELLILWTDHFGPEHLEKHPKLHDMFWKAAKLCGKNKQIVDAQAAAELQAAVKGISDMFWASRS